MLRFAFSQVSDVVFPSVARVCASRFFVVFALGMAVFAVGGCASSSPAPHEISVSVDKPLENTSIQVDIFAVNDTTERSKWEGFSVSDYWEPDNTTRRDLDRVTLEFGRNRPSGQYFPKADARWEHWISTGASSLVVIADIPGIRDGGTTDVRRLILPLAPKAWEKDSDDPVKILVKESGIRLLTPLVPKEKD
ncbi:MAG: hypothetical protein LBS59_02815 [Puniceicoccales bacterium]|jgi:hypothetical protein|nr:hypothetical protein [Puniceicoccales bacterium]